ncbi:MAG TPA: hypothetical protein VM491_18595 [Burkholderiaceae bacterium]|nr:hypothetical protein [Burkholderiaceae bacterium]
MSEWSEWIGWSSATILLLTLSRQVYTQWRTQDTRGVSRWLFVGQTAASTGFLTYSWLLANWVFVVTNALILLTAVVGQIVFWHNRRRQVAAGVAGTADPAATPRWDGEHPR